MAKKQQAEETPPEVAEEVVEETPTEEVVEEAPAEPIVVSSDPDAQVKPTVTLRSKTAGLVRCRPEDVELYRSRGFTEKLSD